MNKANAAPRARCPTAAFTRKCLNLAPDSEAIADERADLIEDFGEVAARLALEDQCGNEEFQVEVGNAVGQAAESVVNGIPRFCSSNTRPNSFPIGSGISVDTMLKPNARLCPARRCVRSFPRRRAVVRRKP